MSNDTKRTLEVKTKRTAKNSVFLDLFQDKKNLLEIVDKIKNKGAYIHKQ